MNPQFSYTQLTPKIQNPLQTVTLQDILGGGVTRGAELAVANPVTQVQQTLEDNLPNFAVGAIGLFMVFIGLTALAAPVAKEVI